jgi:hypothetical protein
MTCQSGSTITQSTTRGRSRLGALAWALSRRMAAPYPRTMRAGEILQGVRHFSTTTPHAPASSTSISWLRDPPPALGDSQAGCGPRRAYGEGRRAELRPSMPQPAEGERLLISRLCCRRAGGATAPEQCSQQLAETSASRCRSSATAGATACPARSRRSS